jgi:hypothetical protein
MGAASITCQTVGGIIKFTHIYIEVRKYDGPSRKWTDTYERSYPCGPSGFLPSGFIIQIFSNISLRTSYDISTMEGPNQLSSLPFPSLSTSHNRLLCDTSRPAQMACLSSSMGTLFLITRIRILCFGRWMVSKAREHEPISLWWMIGSVITFTCFYMEVRKHGISSPKLTDADRCSCPSDSSRFLPSGILIQIFSNISLRTSDDLSTMATPNQSSSLPFSTSLDITSPAQRSPSWRAKGCLNGRYFAVYGHTITLNTHFSSLFRPLDCFQSVRMLAASVCGGGLAVLSKSLIFMQRYVNMMHLVES